MFNINIYTFSYNSSGTFDNYRRPSNCSHSVVGSRVEYKSAVTSYWIGSIVEQCPIVINLVCRFVTIGN